MFLAGRTHMRRGRELTVIPRLLASVIGRMELSRTFVGMTVWIEANVESFKGESENLKCC